MKKTDEPIAAATAHHDARYSTPAVVLHWLLATGLLYQVGLGLWMLDLPKTPVGLRADWFNWHKSVGLILAWMILLRVIWRLTHTPPVNLPGLPRWQRTAATVNHFLLYVGMVGMPLSGFMGSSYSAYPIRFFGYSLPRFWEASPPLKALFGQMHQVCGYVLIFAITLHLLAVLWHGLRRDGVLRRMLPGPG